jgi:flavin-dependent dehydrogenase
MSPDKYSEKLTCDVLIVGSGPAGAAAARTLTKNGYRAIILEKKKLPRYKICSGLVIDRAQRFLQEHFGTPPASVFARPRLLKGARLCLAEDSLIDVPMGTDENLNVWRSEFDFWLTYQSGAEILDEHKFIDFEQTENSVCADVVRKNGRRLQIEASYLIGADGANSLIRRKLQPDVFKQLGWAIPQQLYCIGTVNLEPEYFYGFLNPSFSDFYAWLNFKDEFLVYGVATQKGGRIEPFLKRFTEYLENYFQLKIEKVIRTTGCLHPDMGAKGNFILGRGRVLLVGDAAGFTNAFGEGISSALPTGHIAAESIHEAHTSKESALSIYRVLVEPEREMTLASWEMARAIAGRDF